MRSQKIREVSLNGVTPKPHFFFSKNPLRGLFSRFGGGGSYLGETLEATWAAATLMVP